MVFEMPEEISGQKNSTVLCQGRIIRRKEAGDSESIGLAASILDYKFLRQNSDPYIRGEITAGITLGEIPRRL